MTQRKPISKKLRFEVFKRDSFTCQYCGAHPPAVTLHIDHIIPVKDGGRNDIDNLVASCDGCNLGKGATSLSAIPKTLKEKSADVAEKEMQIRGYSEIMEQRRKRIEAECWQIADTLQPKSSEKGFSRAGFLSIKRFVEQLGFHEVLNSAEISMAKGLWSADRTFKYFCAVCWSKIREAQDGAR